MPDGICTKTSRFQYPPDLAHQIFQFGEGKRYAEKHVGTTGIKEIVGKGQICADVMNPRNNRMGYPLYAGFFCNGSDGFLRIIQGDYLKAILCKEKRASPLTAAKFQMPGLPSRFRISAVFLAGSPDSSPDISRLFLEVQSRWFFVSSECACPFGQFRCSYRNTPHSQVISSFGIYTMKRYHQSPLSYSTVYRIVRTGAKIRATK